MRSPKQVMYLGLVTTCLLAGRATGASVLADFTSVPQQGHTSSVWDLLMHPNGRWLYSGADEKSVKIWDFEAGILLGTIDTPQSVTRIALAEGGKTLVIGMLDSIHTVDSVNGKLKKTRKGAAGGI